MNWYVDVEVIREIMSVCRCHSTGQYQGIQVSLGHETTDGKTWTDRADQPGQGTWLWNLVLVHRRVGVDGRLRLVESRQDEKWC